MKYKNKMLLIFIIISILLIFFLLTKKNGFISSELNGYEITNVRSNILNSEYPIFVNFYTGDNGYKKYNDKLVKSLNKFNLPYYIVEINSKGHKWTRICQQKPYILLNVLNKFPNKHVVWIDADAIIEKEPKLLKNINKDFAVHYIGGTEFASGVLFFKNSKISREIITDWINENEKNYDIWDQVTLNKVIKSKYKLNEYILPKEYCSIFDRPDYQNIDRVISHWQASRELKFKNRKKELSKKIFKTNNNENNPKKIGIIIPSRTIFKDKKKNIKKVQDLPLIKYLLPSFHDKCDKNGRYSYNIYIGYDYDDTFYKENKFKITEFIKRNFNIKNLNISFIEFDKSYSGGKVAAIWSELANIAVKNNCEYLYQLGDDIKFIDSGWENKFINKLQENNNIGVVGPIDLNNTKLLTQSFVHKTHLDIFNTYYPKEIANIYCDNWITDVYKPNYLFMLQDVKVINYGGLSRHVIRQPEIKEIKEKIISKDRHKLLNYINKNKFL